MGLGLRRGRPSPRRARRWLAVLAAAAIAVAVPAPSVAALPSALSVSPAAHDFGSVAVTASADYAFAVWNDGATGATFTSRSQAGSAQFTVAKDDCSALAGPLPPGGSCQFGVKFAPLSTGPFTSSFTFTFDTGSATVTVSGTGAPQMTVSPPSYDFGPVLVGSYSGWQTFTFTNNGTTPSRIMGVDNTNATDFPLVNSDCYTTLAAGASCTMFASFRPSVGGALASRLVVVFDGIPSAVATLTGAGVTAGSPQATRLSGPASPTNAATLSYALTFSKDVTGLDAADFSTSGTASGCTVGAPAGSGSAYTVDVTGCLDGTVVLALRAGSVTDLLGNPGPPADVAAATVTVDRTAPTASFTTTPPALTSASTLSYALNFSEPVTGLASTDFSVAGTATGCAVAAPTGSGGAYTVDLSGCSEGTVVLTLAASSVLDLAGNSGTASAVTAPTVTIDRTAPTASFTTTPPALTNASTLSYALNFSEPVTGLASTDFSVAGTATGCAVAAPTGSGGAYSVAVAGCSEGTVALVLKAGSVADAAGNLGPTVEVSAAVVTVDRTAPAAPVVTAITLRPGAALSGSAVPATVTWTASSDGAWGAGLAASPYTLQRSLSGGAWTTLGRYPGTAAAVSLPASGTLQFRVLAVDAAGNVATGPASPARSAGLVQQSSTAVRYGGTWYAASSTAFSGGSVKWARAAGSSATYTFTGRGVALVTTRAPSRGRVKVYMDGVYTATVDLYRATTQYRVLAWARTWASTRTHTLRLVVVGTAGRPRVDLDAIAVLR
jgi:hypothetical protein